MRAEIIADLIGARVSSCPANRVGVIFILKHMRLRDLGDPGDPSFDESRNKTTSYL